MDLPVAYSKLTPKKRKEVRLEYVKRQNGKCHFCGEDLSSLPTDPDVTNKWIDKRLFPIGFFYWPIHLHHNHKTDMTIGAVHNICNAILFQYHDE